jgi:hypothetical protein
MSKLPKYILLLGLIVILGYLATSLVLEEINQDKDVKNYCAQRCKYNPTSFFWEFSGDYNTKGFTTEDECYNYCTKVRTGFAYILKNYGPAFMGALSNSFKK